jgi:GntR family transcriptional regulator/MocR family aminotransferase
MDPNLVLDLQLAQRGSRHVLKSLHAGLRAAILDGRLAGGLRLPATRELAAALGVSRNTAVAAYDLLASEGYVEARGSAGTRVATLRPRRARRGAAERAIAPWANPAWAGVATMPTAPDDATPRWSFRTGVPDIAAFPFDVFRRLAGRALRTFAREPVGYGAPEGSARLRAAIAGHVSSSRAVACSADDIVVTCGAQQAFDLLARVLVTPGRTTVALEDPGYPPLRVAMAAAGARLAPVPVDDAGLQVERLPSDARIVCVTPSHQFPLGVAMSAARRAALLDFARARSAVVIEDDYDGEFRFASRPLDALKTLDEDGRVFYVGTFSKSMFPALRIGYLVAPAWARGALIAAKQASDWHCNVLVQDTLAHFIEQSHLLRHVRRMRAEYTRRRDALAQAIERQLGTRLELLPAIAGLHLAARAREDADFDAVLVAARRSGVGVESLHRYALRDDAPAGLVFGFGATELATIAEAIRRLARAWREV